MTMWGHCSRQDDMKRQGRFWIRKTERNVVPSSQTRARSESPTGRSLSRRPPKPFGRTDHPGAPASIKLLRHPSSARRGIVSYLTLCLILAFAVSASASSFEIKTESTPSAAHLELNFPEDTQCTGNALDRRELLLQCDRAIDTPATDDVLTELKSWIAWISNGYDTFLIHAARDSSFTVSSTGPRQIVIQLTAVETERTSEDSNTLVPALLKSRLLAATGKPRSAENVLRQSLISLPNNGQLLLELAELELRARRWLYATDRYSKALLDQPLNEDLITLRRKILREHGPAVSSEATAKTLQADHSEFVTSTSADWPLSLPTKLGFRIDQNHFRSLEPSQRNARTRIRNRIEASLQHDFLNGSIINA